MMRAVVSSLVSNNVPPNSFNLGCWMCRRNVHFVSGSCNISRNFVRGLAIKNAGLIASSQSPLREQQQQLSTVLTTSVRNLKTSPASAINWFTPRDDTTIRGRILKKLGFTEIPKSILKMSGYLMYMKVADELDYLKFFNYCHLPDTFASWFTVVELHVWLLSARLMQDGAEGRIVRNSLMKAMWEDNDQKSKKLEGALNSARKNELQLLNEQFHAALFNYDEGILGDDCILAGALWRRFLRLDSDPLTLLPEHFDKPEHHELIADKVKALEMLVIYVRSQFIMLNGLSREQLLRKRAFTFTPFDQGLYDLVAKMEKSEIREGMNVRRVESVKTR